MGGRRLVWIGIGIAVVLLVLLVVTALPRLLVHRELLAEAAAKDSAPVVQVTLVRRAAAASELTLPGTIQALHDGAIYARVAGYVSRFHADIGSVVRAGQVLAEIDAPELEQNVQQARSQLAQTRAALGLAKADLERWRSLARDSAVTGQELDQKAATYDAAVAATGAAEANVRRLTQTREYTQVTAPFAGVITARNVDIGSLITAAGGTSAPVAAGAVGGGGTGSPGSLFRLAQTDTVRMYVSVPDAYATSITTGLSTQIAVQALPGRTFTGRVIRTSGALDVASRTLLTEIDIANRDFALLPGMYAQAKLQFPRVTPPLLLPSSALVIRSGTPRVLVVERGRTGDEAVVHFRPVQVGRDYGESVEILGGLIDGAAVVANASADLAEGSRVRIASPRGAAAPTP
jgi:RND family efflux transporter MFP subunit